jgi:hypothetical protein
MSFGRLRRTILGVSGFLTSRRFHSSPRFRGPIGSCISLAFTIVVLLAGPLLSGCDKNTGNPLSAGATGPSILLAVNSLGNTVSAINLSTDNVTLKAFTVGRSPNQVKVAGGRIYIVNSLSNNIQVFDTASFAPQGTIDLGDGANPMNIAFVGDKGYVSCLLTNDVRVVNLATRAVVKSIPAGSGTTGIAGANGKVYATNTGYSTPAYLPGSVTVINAVTDAVVDTVAVGTNPQAVEVGPDGRVHVVCTGDYVGIPGVVSVIDPVSDAVVKTIPIGGTPGSIAFSSNGTAFVGYFSDGVATYNGRTYAIIDSSTHKLIGTGGAGMASDGNGFMYVADFTNDRVVKLDAAKSVVKTYTVGDGPVSLAVKQ